VRRSRWPNTCLPAFVVVAATLTVGAPAHAIQVCYDYVYSRLTGTDPTPPGGPGQYLGRDTVTRYLTQRGYQPLAVPPPGDQLQQGDVILVPGHVGFVNGPDNIDHFIQVEGTSRSGVKYDTGTLPHHTTLGGQRGGFFKGDTLAGFLSRPFRTPDRYVVWRRGAQGGLVGTWNGIFERQDTHQTGGVRTEFTLTNGQLGGWHYQPSWTMAQVSVAGNVVRFRHHYSDQCIGEHTFTILNYDTREATSRYDVKCTGGQKGHAGTITYK
jgi:hypothetical protein